MISDSYYWISDTFHRILSGNNPGPSSPEAGSVASSTPTNANKPNLGLDIPNNTRPNTPIIPNTNPNTNPNTPMSAGPNPWTDPNSTTVTPTSSFFYSFI